MPVENIQPAPDDAGLGESVTPVDNTPSGSIPEAQPTASPASSVDDKLKALYEAVNYLLKLRPEPEWTDRLNAAFEA